MTEEIDRIYDDNVALEKLKAGTKYERLAAIIFKFLNGDATVVHDVRVRADGMRTLHQLDVRLTHRGRERHVVVECRDYDTGEVEQADVMKFDSTLRQLGASGVMVTNTRFTKGARSYAEDESIVLAELRPATEADMENRIRTIVITLNIFSPAGDPKITFVASEPPGPDDDVETVREEALTADVMITLADGTTRSIREDLLGALSAAPLEVGTHAGQFRYDEPVGLSWGSTTSQIVGFDWEQDWISFPHEIRVESDDRIPLLLLRTLDGELDRIVSDRDLTQWQIGVDGTIEPRHRR